MKLRVRKYKCPKCKKVVKRLSDKKWIKSICDDFGITTRLMLISKTTH
jgi:ribosomal protein L37AE/L43A